MCKIFRDIPPKIRQKINFTIQDAVLVLEFLAKFVNEFDTEGEDEAKDFRLLPEFLSSIALKQFTSVSQAARAHYG